MVGPLTRSPERSTPVWPVARLKTPHASRVERTHLPKQASHEPHGRDLHPLCALSRLRANADTSKRRSRHRHGLESFNWNGARFVRIARLRLSVIAPKISQRPDSSPTAKRARQTQLDRTLGLFPWSGSLLSDNESLRRVRSLLQRASIELSEPLSWHSARRVSTSALANTGRLASLRSLSPVDETEIPGSAVPVKRRQHTALIRRFMTGDDSDGCASA